MSYVSSIFCHKNSSYFRSNTREGRGLFTLFYIEKTIKSFVTRIEELEQSSQAQASKIEQLEQKLSKLDNIDTAGGLQSYDGAQVSCFKLDRINSDSIPKKFNCDPNCRHNLINCLQEFLQMMRKSKSTDRKLIQNAVRRNVTEY